MMLMLNGCHYFHTVGYPKQEQVCFSVGPVMCHRLALCMLLWRRWLECERRCVTSLAGIGTTVQLGITRSISPTHPVPTPNPSLPHLVLPLSARPWSAAGIHRTGHWGTCAPTICLHIGSGVSTTCLNERFWLPVKSSIWKWIPNQPCNCRFVRP